MAKPTGRPAFRVTIDAEKATQGFNEARKEMKRRLKTGLEKAAERVAVPAARSLAPFKTGKLKGAITGKATQGGSAYLTVRGGKKMGYAGLLEFGGTVRKPIRPKKGKALVINGSPVAKVTTPRKYSERAFMRTAISVNRDRIAEAISDEVMKAFDEGSESPV